MMLHGRMNGPAVAICMGSFVLGILLLASCRGGDLKDKISPEIEFLTRTGCSNTPTLRSNLEKVVNINDVKFTSQSELDDSDYRTGYPTPTILIRGEDAFGLKRPTEPFAGFA